MKLPLELRVGLRYLRAKRKQAFVSVISAFGVLGVMLGVMTLIIVLGVMNGFERDLKDKILGTVSHIVVMNNSTRSITDWAQVMDRIKLIDGINAVTPYIYGQAMLSSRGRVRGVIVRGIDPKSAPQVISISKYMEKGSLKDLGLANGDINGVIIGKELATSNSLRVGDSIQLISPQGKRTPIGAIPRVQNFRVVGIFKSGMYEFDSNLVYMDLAEAQKFFEMGSGVTGIEVNLKNIYDAPKIASRIDSVLGAPYWTRTWRDMYRNLFSALKLEKIAMFIILTFIVSGSSVQHHYFPNNVGDGKESGYSRIKITRSYFRSYYAYICRSGYDSRRYWNTSGSNRRTRRRGFAGKISIYRTT